MKLLNVLMLVFATCSVQSQHLGARSSRRIRNLDYFANVTYAPAALTESNCTTPFAGDIPPPESDKPPPDTPKEPFEPYLPLYPSASDEVWEKARCKGQSFVRACRGTDREAGQLFRPPRNTAASEFDSIGMVLSLDDLVRKLTRGQTKQRSGVGSST